MDNFQSLIFYIVSFFASVVLYFLYNKHNKKVFLIASFCIPLIIGGFRYYVGTDYPTYIGLYNMNLKLGLIDLFSRNNVEVGFLLICYISKFFNGYSTMFFIFNFLTLFFTFLCLNKINVKYRTIAYFCYLFLYFTLSFNGIRQMLAVSILLLGYKYIHEKNIKLWLLSCVIATCFHKTALFVLPIYFVFVSKKKIIKIISVLAIIFIALNYQVILDAVSNIDFLSKFERYKDYTSNYSFNNYSFYLYALIFGYVSLFYKKLIKFDEKNKIYFLIFAFGFILTFTGFISPDVKRMATYFKIMEIVLLPQIPLICTNSKDKLLNCGLICLYSVGSFILYAYILQQSGVIPFQFIFNM